MLRPYHPEIPKDVRTLLGTPRTCISKPLHNGTYVHLGLERGILDEVQRQPTTLIEEIRLQLHIDGMNLFNGSGQCLWPILARICYPFVGQPFVVGVFCGYSKPEPVEQFLEDCIQELKDMLASGIRTPIPGKLLKVEVAHVICDAPARAYVRRVKGHNGHYACDR